MTVITKPLTEKKSSKLKEPLVENANVQTGVPNPDVESGDESRYVIVGALPHRASTSGTICMFLTALLVMSIGVIGGIILYKQFSQSNLQRYEGWCKIPYDKPTYSVDDVSHHEQLVADAELLENIEQGLLDQPQIFIDQEFSLDLEGDNYETIDVPDFKGGRKGRFIHDFYANKTGIVDIDGRRCFVMPLNRQRVLPPRSMYDLINKMRSGYYDVDTGVVRDTMRVVTPPITDFKDLGQFITKECKDVRTYMLEKETRKSIFKRSAPSQTHFTEFAGNKISELFINLDELDAYEKERAAP